MLNFVVQTAEAERPSSSAWLTVGIAIAAAIFSALAAIAVAFLRHRLRIGN
jgi:ABC-type sulfate transport system permease component